MIFSNNFVVANIWADNSCKAEIALVYPSTVICIFIGVCGFPWKMETACNHAKVARISFQSLRIHSHAHTEEHGYTKQKSFHM